MTRPDNLFVVVAHIFQHVGDPARREPVGVCGFGAALALGVDRALCVVHGHSGKVLLHAVALIRLGLPKHGVEHALRDGV